MVVQLEGKVALVTGGSSGIGRATALAFAREGAKVVIADVAVEGGEETVSLIEKANGEALFVKTDVSKSTEVRALRGMPLSLKHGLKLLSPPDAWELRKRLPKL